MVNATHVHACDSGACNTAEGMTAATIADATIVIAGLNMSVERESNDREDLLLPRNQTSWINAVADASPTPIVLVIMSAGGVDVSFAHNNTKIGAIVWAGYPGEEGGTAIADVLFGKYNPGMLVCSSNQILEMHADPFHCILKHSLDWFSTPHFHKQEGGCR